MRIAPLAVWCQNLSISEVERAVISDVTFTHSREEMGHLCTAYSLLITTLIASVQVEDRAVLAVTVTREYSQMPHVNDMVREFIDVAQALANAFTQVH